MKFDWYLFNIDPPSMAVARRIQSELKISLYQQMPHLADLFPFYDDRYDYAGGIMGDWIVVRLRVNKKQLVPKKKTLKDREVEQLHLVVGSFIPKSYLEWSNLLGVNWYNIDTFTYIGPCNDSWVSWDDIKTQLFSWLQDLVIPEIESRNKRRVLEAIPKSPQYDVEKILRNVYILESDFSQGTCFHLKSIGLVTCEHVLRGELRVFPANQITKQYKVKKSVFDSTLDIAVIDVPDLELQDGLEIGSSDNVSQMDHVAVAGFPNYRLGDSGIFSPGLVIGFRTISAIRRILVNAHIVQGNSGGPVVNAQGQVIGIAVTGADRQEDVDKTENHSVVPIETIKFLNLNRKGQ